MADLPQTVKKMQRDLSGEEQERLWVTIQSFLRERLNQMT